MRQKAWPARNDLEEVSLKLLACPERYQWVGSSVNGLSAVWVFELDPAPFPLFAAVHRQNANVRSFSHAINSSTDKITGLENLGKSINSSSR